MTVKFQQVQIGEIFEFRGRRYRKVAMSMAHDEDRCGNVFQENTDVVPHAGAQPRQAPAPTR
jgi:hypothetical protein